MEQAQEEAELAQVVRTLRAQVLGDEDTKGKSQVPSGTQQAVALCETMMELAQMGESDPSMLNVSMTIGGQELLLCTVSSSFMMGALALPGTWLQEDPANKKKLNKILPMTGGQAHIKAQKVRLEQIIAQSKIQEGVPNAGTFSAMETGESSDEEVETTSYECFKINAARLSGPPKKEGGGRGSGGKARRGGKKKKR